MNSAMKTNQIAWDKRIPIPLIPAQTPVKKKMDHNQMGYLGRYHSRQEGAEWDSQAMPMRFNTGRLTDRINALYTGRHPVFFENSHLRFSFG
jgi:hypothetical protein